MACALMGVEKVSDPSLTASCVEPYLTLGVNEEAFESHVTNVLTAYSVASIKLGLQFLRTYDARLLASFDWPVLVRSNGFFQRDYVYIIGIGGNGLLTIYMSHNPVAAKGKYGISFIDHATDAFTFLGYFSSYGVPLIDSSYEHMPRLLLCRVTPNGNYVVLLGPSTYALSRSYNKKPVIAIYQLEPPMQLFEKRFKDTPFIKCAPIAIALSPASISGGQYLVAIVTFDMTVILLNVVTLEWSTVQLESVHVQAQFHDSTIEEFSRTDCVSFSADGRLLSVMCNMQNEPTCLIMDVSTLEPLCWMAADRNLSWLRWIFPMFSACGTKVVLSTFSEHENVFDQSKYELMFYKISGMQSLKVLCRVVILELVKSSSSLDQLPLPQDLITFLGGGRKTLEISDSELGDTEPSHRNANNRTCRCNLL